MAEQTITKLLDIIKNDSYLTDFKDSSYFFDDNKVPRVTKILSKCIHSDGLMYWANNLGFKRLSYSQTLKNASEIGSQCHENIDAFMEDENHPTPKAPHEIKFEALSAYQGFLKWFNDIKSNAAVEIIFHEQTIVCPYFGGTLDGLFKINGKYYLVDYKTSNHITYKYCLQLAAYRYMLRVVYGIEVDGCIILQLSKSGSSYNEFVLSFFDNPYHLEFINACERAFFAIVYAYYNIAIIDNMYGELGWEVL